MNKLQTTQFYEDSVLTNDEQYKKYTDAQINRHGLKKDKNRGELYYKRFFDVLEEFLDKNKHYEMICYGTRNNQERNHWKHWFNMFKYDVNVKSLDIAPDSSADFILDFNKLPNDFENKWDIIFSNSIDHAPNATETFYNWTKTLKIDGILVIFFCCGVGTAFAADCSVFDGATIKDFFGDVDGKNYIVLKSFLDSAYLIKRIS